MNRRTFLATGVAASVIEPQLGLASPEATSRQASGVKVGEVTSNTAMIWTRLTVSSTRNLNGVKPVGRPKKDKSDEIPAETSKLHGACPGAAGRIRVRYGSKPDLSDAQTTSWVDVDVATDFSHVFSLKKLPEDAVTYFAVETADPGEAGKSHGELTGSFRTAPALGQKSEVSFAVITCQMYSDLDHDDGFHIYPAIAKLKPRFVAFTGDNVYYDSEQPVAVSAALARYHWERMYSLPRHVELLRTTASYWEKDDHDTVKNDSWPGQKLGQLTFAEGQKIFREQVAIGQSIYRTFRWGQFLQIWLTDGRDFRSANSMADGPEKTIWGKEQKEWLFRTVKESDATWKVLISPTPIVGPDRGNKGDNHANEAFKHEGTEIRNWFKQNVPKNFFTICGDRHWQFHSVHPDTGLNEFSVGAASDKHAGGSPGEDKNYHRFHRVKGGFLTVSASEKSILFQHRDVEGNEVYRFEVKA